MSVERLKEIIASVAGEHRDEFVSMLAHDVVDLEKEWDMERLVSELGEYQLVKQEGGGEGGGEYCVSTIRFGDKYYNIYYSYYSHYGFDTSGSFDSITEVKPVEVTVTQYHPV